ncbi:hypothetical protein EV122DRAFT_289454 [Schizophyllum commune]
MTVRTLCLARCVRTSPSRWSLPPSPRPPCRSQFARAAKPTSLLGVRHQRLVLNFWRSSQLTLGYPQRVNPLHADIPSLPQRYSESSEYYWYYGFALSLQEIRDLAQHHTPQTLETPDGSTAPDLTLITGLLLFCMAKTGWDFISQVLVQPVPESADMVQTLRVYPAPNGQPTVFFFSVMATQEDMLATRPSQVQIDELVKILKKEPEWREDAIPKSEKPRLSPMLEACARVRVHPQHAEIPALPARYSPTSNYYCQLALRLPSLHRRGSFHPRGMGSLARPNVPHGRMSCLLVVTNRIWPFTKLFDAQPEEGSADNVQTVLETLYDRRAVSFYSLMSTETEHFVSRPGPKEVEALTTLFRKQLVWRKDAIEKECEPCNL